jgi:hypothetical protein
MSAIRLNPKILRRPFGVVIWVLVLICAYIANSFASPGRVDFATWLAPSPNEQLYKEGLDDVKGMGRLFVPAMTTPANEPLYAVFRAGDLMGERVMGSSFFLEPGTYTVILGTGNLEQRIHRDVVIPREGTVILEPDWCSLTVEIIDESRNSYSQDLQIFSVSTGESFGILPAINPELGEQLQTLVLPQGLYKIVKRGRDFNTFVNFATVLLEEGVYTPFTVVVNSVTEDFTGAGILSSTSQLKQIKHWRIFGALHGNVILTANNLSSRDLRTNVTLISQFENRLLFDRFPHYYLSSNLLDLGALKQHGARFVINQDRLQLKNTYVYFILNWLGGYARLEASTHLLPTMLLFDPPKSITLLDPSGRIEGRKVNVTKFEAAPILFPLGLKEGLGVNITPVKKFNTRISIRSGLGYRQNYNHNVYYQSGAIDTLYQRSPNNSLRGLETSLVSNLSFFQNLVITTELDVLFPFGREKEVMDLENFISYGVTKNITLEHTLRLQRNPTLYDYIIQEQLVSIRLSYYLF